MRVSVFGPAEDPKPRQVYQMDRPRFNYDRWRYTLDANMAVDFHTEPPTIWTSLAFATATGAKPHTRCNVRLWRPKGRKLVLKRSFAAEAGKSLVRSRAWKYGRPRLAVDPVSGRLYMGLLTWDTVTKGVSFSEVVVVDPQTGKNRVEALPTDPEDLTFDWKGRAYLRTYNAVTRFDPRQWREVPWDYGERRTVHHGAGGGGEKPYKAVSALTLPSDGKGCIHLGGMGVNVKGNVAVSCMNPSTSAGGSRRTDKKALPAGASYRPRVFPGRFAFGPYNGHGQLVHVFDRHGKVVRMDSAPGLKGINDVEIDRDGNLYVLAAATPYLDGKPYFNGRGCTLIKVRPGKMKALVLKGIIPLPEAMRPKRPFDMTRPGIWVGGAEWLFGPVGGDSHYGSGGKCHCGHLGRFALDYYARSFAPEIDRFRVVVLDSGGNVILRIGRYGNADDGVPLVKPDPSLTCEQGAQPPDPRGIGGDEVAIMHAPVVAVHSDRRLFVADEGNQCIRCVKLDYHAEARVTLKDVPDRAK
jgi:hypothetical protein